MILGEIYPLLVECDQVQVNDYKMTNKSKWTVGELQRRFPDLPVNKLTFNKNGLIIYTEQNVAKELST